MTAPAAPTKTYRPVPDKNDPFSYVPEAQDFLTSSVQGYGEALKPEILGEIGRTLGNFNEIGGLRSGGVPVALGDVAGKYGAMIGAYAKQASAAGLGAGLEARRQKFTEDEARRKRKSGLLKAIGGVLGAGIGFFAGGPAGAAAGFGAGESFGGGGSYDTGAVEAGINA
jgi:hypothetical protein